MSYKCCFVPCCPNTSHRCPYKIFVSVPRKERERLKWIEASRRDMTKSPVSMNSYLTCCEDHFDMENDVQNWIRVKFFMQSGLSTQVRLKGGVVPHKFACQEGRTNSSGDPRKSIISGLSHQRKTQDLMEVDDSPSEPPVEKNQPSSTTLSEDIVSNISSGSIKLKSPVEQQTQTPVRTVVSKGIQVNLKPNCRSTYSQTNEDRIMDVSETVDTRTQMIPQLTPQLKLTSTVEESATSSSTIYSGGGSIMTEKSHSSIEYQFDKQEFSEKSIVVTLARARNNPTLHLGISHTCFQVIGFLASKVGTPERNVLLCLKKIRLNLPFEYLGEDFGLSEKQASRIFSETVEKLAATFDAWICLPSPQVCQPMLPLAFQHRYKKVQSILDCFEVNIEEPCDPTAQSLTRSKFRKANTLKYLVSATPNGLINFVSKGYRSSTTDSDITLHCGYLDKLPEGSKIMAHRGFKNLVPHLQSRGLSLVRPPSVTNGEFSSKSEARKVKRIARLRTPIKRVITKMRGYAIISPRAVTESQLVYRLDAVVKIIAGLVNIQDSCFL